MARSNYLVTPQQQELLSKDAGNRALRTFLQGLAVAIVLGIITWLMPVITNARGWDDLADWRTLTFSLVQVVLTTGFAFVMRRFLDPSGIPTPLPPEPAVPPTEERPDAV